MKYIHACSFWKLIVVWVAQHIEILGMIVLRSVCKRKMLLSMLMSSVMCLHMLRQYITRHDQPDKWTHGKSFQPVDVLIAKRGQSTFLDLGLGSLRLGLNGGFWI